MLRAEDIVHPGIRAAAMEFERQTGRKLALELGDEQNEGIIAIFLVTNGFAPGDGGEREDPGPQAA